MTFSKITLAATFAAFANAVEPNPPTWDSNRVKILTPGQHDAQDIVDTIYNMNGGHNPAWHGQWSDDRFAIFFTKGVHNVNVNVGYYTTIHGLGRHPDETTVNDLRSDNGDFNFQGGALANFWRGAENLRIDHDITWAVSQAAPLRRVHVEGNLFLSQYNGGNPAQGYASGGFIADVQVDQTIDVCSQQQFLLRNIEMQSFKGYVWNYVHVGSTNTPADHCGNQGGFANTVVEKTPSIAEKPYIIQSGDKYTLMKPNVETNKVGNTPNFDNAEEIDFANVYVANENDPTDKINSKLSEGLHVVFQPGNYKLTDTLRVNKANTVLLGFGLATLIATTGQPCITVSSVDGVRIAGFLLQAGAVESSTLLQMGDLGYAGDAANPGVVSDVYARVGGTNATGDVKTNSMMKIDSSNVIVDNAWLWRADHDVGGLVYNSRNPVENGLVVNGDHVTTFGLAAEHTLGDLTQWNGNYGTSYFYQAEFPYDVTQANYGDKGYAGYKVGDNVTNHDAFGTGVYSFFRDNNVNVANAIVTPSKPNVKVTHALTVFLDGKGSINHIVDGQGETVAKQGTVKYVCYYQAANPLEKVEAGDFLM